MSFTEPFARQSKTAVYVETALIVAVIGYIDWITGREISFFAFYSIPIFIAVWYGDRRAGLVMAVASTFTWWWANKDVHTFTTAYGYPTATFSRLVFYIFVAYGGSALKAQHDSNRARIAALERARKLEREIVSVSDREQRRIGQDLHDGLCQTLAAIGCAATSLKDDLQQISAPHAAAAEEIEKFLNDAVVEARNLARGISPVDMDEHGLVAALDDLAERTTRLTPLPVDFESRGEIGVVDPQMAINLYRIAQESVNNAVRHSHASHIEITLSQAGSTLTLTVQDDGDGIPENITSDGMGMRTMSYRAQMLGGTLKISSAPGDGTSISCSVRTPSEPAPSASPAPPALASSS
jgi:signal transduction histidine kinase